MKKDDHHIAGNKNKQDEDKAPGEERGKGEKVTKEDLKGKKVDADPAHIKDLPALTGTRQTR